MINDVQKIHLVGIGGAAMSGIAEILLSLGYRVSGSDLHGNDATERLRGDGVEVMTGHRAENTDGADVVVFSSAVPRDNPELVAARERRIPVIRRAEMQGELMRMKYGIGIAGTHGKTTTTSMIGGLLTDAGLDPTVMVGGRMLDRRSHAYLGKGKYMVVEADEFDRTFLKLHPVLAVITTLEAEHLDCYTDLDDIRRAFLEYASHVPFYGSVVLCLDEKTVQDLIPHLERNVITYGFSPQAEVRAEDVRFNGTVSEFSVTYDGDVLGRVTLHAPGTHNIRNALAAVAVGLELKIPFDVIRGSLERFAGVKRRFELKGETDGVMVVDDFAHHPTEIEATLSAARKGWEHRRIVAVFQPHLFSRTRDFCDMFARAFLRADVLVATEIYPSRERPIPGVSGRMVADKAVEFGHHDVHFIPEREEVAPFLRTILRENDMVITLGAGDIWKTGEELTGRK